MFTDPAPFPTTLEVFSSVVFGEGIFFSIIPILLGAMLHRSFVAVWHFLSIIIVFIVSLLLISPFISSGFRFKIDMMLLPFLFASFYTMVSFIIASITKNKITNVNNAPLVVKITILILIYSLIVSLFIGLPLLFFTESNISIFIGTALSLTFVYLLFKLLKKSQSYPKKEIVNRRSDYWYFVALLIIFLFSTYFAQQSYLP